VGSNQNILISFVIPFFNEEECVEKLYSRIRETAESIGIKFEMVCINDHSTDSTVQVLRKIRQNDQRVKIVSFSRSFGHQIAVTAGLRYASGDCVVVMDADLQDPPELVNKMIEKWQQGFEVVYGIRRNRKESFFRIVSCKIFYLLIHNISPIKIPFDAGDFCLMSRRVVREMRKLNEEDPFVRGLRAWVGFKQTGIEYERNSREAGSSKYNILELFGLALDGILSFSVVTLRLATVIGLIVSFFSIAYAFYIGISRILIALGYVSPTNLIPGWATLICSLMLLIGLQFIFLGILGEYVGRIFTQVKGRPLYVVEEEIGFEDDK
jgi:dolichol-phosphate mannosyltransferase